MIIEIIAIAALTTMIGFFVGYKKGHKDAVESMELTADEKQQLTDFLAWMTYDGSVKRHED